MIDSYVIINRKTPLIIKMFIINFIILLLLVIWGINTLLLHSYIQIHSKFLNFESFYYLEVLIPVKEVNQITLQNQIIIDSKKYNYKIYKIDSNVTYKNNQNYQKVYLEILNIDKSYLINGYELDVKILKEKKKIIDYFKE